MMPSRNFFGDLYPTYDHDRLIEIFNICQNDRVLDIGGGHNPFSRADCIVEYDLGNGVHRDGQKISEAARCKIINADLCNGLPFEDKSFDFVFCAHVLEHVSDPETACNEIIRVGKRGFIETPRKFTEFFAGHPSHQWLVDTSDNTLIFEKRQFIESPYLNCALIEAWKNEKLEEYGLRNFRNLTCVQFYWKDSFNFRIAGKETNSFDYTNPSHAAMSHYYFARNVLLLNAPLQNGIFHAETAARICPENEFFWTLCAAYALALGDNALWLKAYEFLYNKKILTFGDGLLAKIGIKRKTMKKILDMINKVSVSETAQ